MKRIAAMVFAAVLTAAHLNPAPSHAASFRFAAYRVNPRQVFRVAAKGKTLKCAPTKAGLVAGRLRGKRRFVPAYLTKYQAARRSLLQAPKSARRPLQKRVRKIIRRQLALNALCGGSPSGPSLIGAEALLPEDTETWYAAWINRAPGNGNTVDLNPPRFRWPFSFAVTDGCQRNEPECNSEYGTYHRDNFEYHLQVARDPAFENLVTDVSGIQNINFYNFLSPFDTSQTKTFFWRVGYLSKSSANVHYGEFHWSEVWSFTIAENATEWDRSAFSEENFGAITTQTKPHPRMFLSEGLVSLVKARIGETKYARQLTQLSGLLRRADRTLDSDWYKVMLQWPDSPDRPTQDEVNQAPQTCAQTNYILPCRYELPWGSRAIAEELVYVAFAYKWTGDSKYAGVKDRFLKIAGYPRGSSFGPEGFGSNCCGFNSEYWLGLLFDWLYNDMSEPERAAGQAALEWRIRALLCYSQHALPWLCTSDSSLTDYIDHGGVSPLVGPGIMSKGLESHTLGNMMYLIPAAVSLMDKSDVGKYFFQFELNHLIGVNHYGYDTPTQGNAYSMLHQSALLNPSLLLHSAFPEFKLNKNPYYSKALEFLVRQTPVGMVNSPWGGTGGHCCVSDYRDEYGTYKALPNYFSLDLETYPRQIAHFSGYKTYLDVTEELRNLVTPRYEKEQPYNDMYELFYPFITEEAPSKEFDPSPVKLYRNGWVTAASENPYTKSAFLNGAGFIFECRANGVMSHGLSNDLTYQLWAYGQELNFPSAGTGVEDSQCGISCYMNNLISTNVISVNGADQSNGVPYFKHPCNLYAFEQGNSFVYAAGDATPSVSTYIWSWTPEVRDYTDGNLKDLKRHMLFVKNKYFVVFDNLRAERPLRYSWKEHIYYDHDFSFDTSKMRLRYKLGNVTVQMVHIGEADKLVGMDLLNEAAFTHPYTGRVYQTGLESLMATKHVFPIHHPWVSNKDISSQFYFFTVIYPTRPGEAEPEITRRDPLTAEIKNNDGSKDVISFAAARPPDATLWVDLMKIDGFIADPDAGAVPSAYSASALSAMN